MLDHCVDPAVFSSLFIYLCVSLSVSMGKIIHPVSSFHHHLSSHLSTPPLSSRWTSPIWPSLTFIIVLPCPNSLFYLKWISLSVSVITLTVTMLSRAFVLSLTFSVLACTSLLFSKLSLQSNSCKCTSICLSTAESGAFVKQWRKTEHILNCCSEPS